MQVESQSWTPSKNQNRIIRRRTKKKGRKIQKKSKNQISVNNSTRKIVQNRLKTQKTAKARKKILQIGHRKTPKNARKTISGKISLKNLESKANSKSDKISISRPQKQESDSSSNLRRPHINSKNGDSNFQNQNQNPQNLELTPKFNLKTEDRVESNNSKQLNEQIENSSCHTKLQDFKDEESRSIAHSTNKIKKSSKSRLRLSNLEFRHFNPNYPEIQNFGKILSKLEQPKQAADFNLSLDTPFQIKVEHSKRSFPIKKENSDQQLSEKMSQMFASRLYSKEKDLASLFPDRKLKFENDRVHIQKSLTPQIEKHNRLFYNDEEISLEMLKNSSVLPKSLSKSKVYVEEDSLESVKLGNLINSGSFFNSNKEKSKIPISKLE